MKFHTDKSMNTYFYGFPKCRGCGIDGDEVRLYRLLGLSSPRQGIVCNACFAPKVIYKPFLQEPEGSGRVLFLSEFLNTYSYFYDEYLQWKKLPKNKPEEEE